MARADRAFERFLGVHGHREVDFDAYHPTWIGQPWVVLDVRLLLQRDDLPDPGAAEQESRIRQQVTEREFLARVPEEIRTFVGEIARLARTYTALDDLEHYQTTRLTPPFRAALLEIGKRLVDAGALDAPSDVFFLLLRRRRHPRSARRQTPAASGRSASPMAFAGNVQVSQPFGQVFL